MSYPSSEAATRVPHSLDSFGQPTSTNPKPSNPVDGSLSRETSEQDLAGGSPSPPKQSQQPLSQPQPQPHHHGSATAPGTPQKPQQQQQQQRQTKSLSPPDSPTPVEKEQQQQGVVVTHNNSGSSNGNNTLLSVGFNQDYGCFACGTDTGFRIYNCDPFKETFRREFNNGGIGLVEMLFRCNILAIVGGGSTPRYPPNKVMIWDDHQSRCIGELSFRSEIRAVRLRRDRIVVVLEHKIYVYNFADLKLLHQIETIANPKGLCALSPASNPSVLACPGLHRGQVRVEHYTMKKTKFISAHDSNLACFALTLDGRLLATSSNKGTLIRVFNTLDGTRLQELRRGADRAEIYSLAFSSTAQWLALSSDKGTVHVFSLRATSGTEDVRGGGGEPPQALSPPGPLATGNKANGNGNGNVSPVAGSSPLSFGSGNPGSSFSFMKGVLPRYFSSEWSFAQYRLPEETKSIVAFGPQKNSVIIVGSDGSFYKCAFDPAAGGEMVQQEYTKFMRPDEETSL